MQSFTTLVSILAMMPGLLVNACDCHHNNDAGRWKGSQTPSSAIAELCKEGGACKENGHGARLCVLGDISQCLCAVEAAESWQSKHGGDWFLWSGVNCGDLTVTMNAA
ncbi:hypothetical protein F5Y00DRAFT_261932 [Daldinia vernicosa]|uniref:uncharacterized protein n=1 Tax=Daldinia vernicosa TaxID=114800 RepID=UPI002008DA4E|nr:uncharacterized protein F5Y00DRAFT_261932 [Daldinia vernicosa]KAI0849116.1 hypothetical protein F5Y00DRAFT_261932 [Daldinia vernicosa]